MAKLWNSNWSLNILVTNIIFHICVFVFPYLNSVYHISMLEFIFGLLGFVLACVNFLQAFKC